MESTITSKGQMTLPKEAREYLGLEPGDRVKVFKHPDGRLVLLPKKPASELQGLFKNRSKRRVSIEEMNEAIASGATAGAKPGRRRR